MYENGIGPQYRLAIYGPKMDQTSGQNLGFSVRIRIEDETILGPISVRIRIGHPTAYTRVLVDFSCRPLTLAHLPQREFPLPF